MAVALGISTALLLAGAPSAEARRRLAAPDAAGSPDERPRIAAPDPPEPPAGAARPGGRRDRDLRLLVDGPAAGLRRPGLRDRCVGLRSDGRDDAPGRCRCPRRRRDLRHATDARQRAVDDECAVRRGAGRPGDLADTGGRVHPHLHRRWRGRRQRFPVAIAHAAIDGRLRAWRRHGRLDVRRRLGTGRPPHGRTGGCPCRRPSDPAGSRGRVAHPRGRACPSTGRFVRSAEGVVDDLTPDRR